MAPWGDQQTVSRDLAECHGTLTVRCASLRWAATAPGTPLKLMNTPPLDSHTTLCNNQTRITYAFNASQQPILSVTSTGTLAPERWRHVLCHSAEDATWSCQPTTHHGNEVQPPSEFRSSGTIWLAWCWTALIPKQWQMNETSWPDEGKWPHTQKKLVFCVSNVKPKTKYSPHPPSPLLHPLVTEHIILSQKWTVFNFLYVIWDILLTPVSSLQSTLRFVSYK